MKDCRPLLTIPIAELLRRIQHDYKSYSRLHKYLSGKLKCPSRLCLLIEAESEGEIKRGDLRPDLWPDLHYQHKEATRCGHGNCTWCGHGIDNGVIIEDASGTEHHMHNDCLAEVRGFMGRKP